MARPKIENPAKFVGIRIRQSALDRWTELAADEDMTIREAIQTHLEAVDGLPTVYRLFSENDELLYVGCSQALPSRLSNHRSQKPWWSEVHNIAVELHPNRDQAALAEKLAIDSEQPRYNGRSGLDRNPIRKRPVKRMATLLFRTKAEDLEDAELLAWWLGLRSRREYIATALSEKLESEKETLAAARIGFAGTQDAYWAWKDKSAADEARRRARTPKKGKR